MGSEGKKTLVVDAGSTKAAWGIAASGASFVTRGVNALTASDQELRSVLREAGEKAGDEKIDQIYWYGAGCATTAVCSRLRSALEAEFAPATVQVASDLVGAARALFGNGQGIASILGTGSNSGYFDGLSIAFQVPSLGFILGDEGSGVAIGKSLLAKALRGSLPQYLSEELSRTMGVDLASVLERVYRGEAPNRYLASFVPFVAEHEDDDAMKELVSEEFRNFAGKILTAYPQAHEAPLGFVGSIAWRFRPLLEKTLDEFGLRAEKIIKDPMEGLLKYHA